MQQANHRSIVYAVLTKLRRVSVHRHLSHGNSDMTQVEHPLANHDERWQKLLRAFAFLLGLYFLTAYLVLPFFWSRYIKWHPALNHAPGITSTSDGHPGDPLNLAIIGSEEDLKSIMKLAGWFPADHLSLHSDVKIAADTVLDRPYVDAPVSNLFLWGRKEDLAFEQPVGDNPRHRHHVRFWKSSELDSNGKPLWIGAATYDKSVGLSDTTVQITHHIDPEIDKERDHLVANLVGTHELVDIKYKTNFHPDQEGYNGGGDLWKTDGRLAVGTINVKATSK